MLRKQPYWGFLIMALLLLGLAAAFREQQKAKLHPAAMAAAVEEMLQKRDLYSKNFVKDTQQLQQLLYSTLSDANYQDYITPLPFYVFAYNGDSLIFWNDNDMEAPPATEQDSIGSLVFYHSQYAIRKTFFYPKQRSLVLLLPVKLAYPIESRYLSSHFIGLNYIPGNTEVIGQNIQGTLPISTASGHRWLNLKFHPTDDNPPPLPDNATGLVFAASLLLFFVWLQLIQVNISKRKGWRLGLVFTIIVLLVLRILLRILPLPFGFSELLLFSPTIYGYNWLLPSLGDLLINTLMLLWLAIYVLTRTPYNSYRLKTLKKPVRFIAGAVILALFPIIISRVWFVLNSLVLDSQISFEVGHFHKINEYTIAGLLAIVLGGFLLELTMRFLFAQLIQIITKKVIAICLILFCCSAGMLLLGVQAGWAYIVPLWVAGYLYVIGLDMHTKKGLLSFRLVFLSLFTCLCSTILLHHLLRTRDLDKDRIAYAAHILAKQDPLLEYTFKNIGSRIQNDPAVSAFMDRPNAEAKTALDLRLTILYLNTVTNRYQPEIYLLDAAGYSLSKADSTVTKNIVARFNSGMPGQDDYLVFNEQSDGGNNYLARIPITSPKGLRGYLFLSLKLKQNVNETIYPALLQPPSANRVDKDARYAYALYTNGKRITQSSNYNFPLRISTSKETAPPTIKRIRDGYYELRYQETPQSEVIVAGSSGTLMSAAILLSYLFFIHLLLILIGLGYQLLLKAVLNIRMRSYQLTLQQRIHFGIIIILLSSFVVVGIATLLYFRETYTAANSTARHNTTEGVARFVKSQLAEMGGEPNPAVLDSIANTPDFRAAIYSIAASQKIDINVFDYGGKLLLASQEDLYTKEQGLLAGIMHPLAFRALHAGATIADESEYVNLFDFLVCYTPVRNDEGDVLAYISIPFFSSREEFLDQISNIVVALLSLYAILFFFSNFLAFYISTRLTRAFNVLIAQFGLLNLQKNELLSWPYDDEIGVLVKEYNKMAVKVEENAAKLAQSEREGAWREMARQVAHEIKNPLTPMRLNIQYLQQALKSGRQDVEALATRVIASIIEQIDNLTYIASEFSDFAAMPEPKPAVFALDELIRKAAPLYHGEQNGTVTVNLPRESVFVLADYSQLLRVFTNLMQNAFQAIPPERGGAILVTLAYEAGYATLQVADNGTGINEEDAGRIFKPYFTTKSSGTGLGLAMSRKIIELWKGTIWFESMENKGTTFFLKLPATNTETVPD